MQFETPSSHVCVCVRAPVSVCLRVGGCVFTCAAGGEVAVKSVLFSPVGRIRSLQVRTACHCNRSHRRCGRRRRLQRWVRTPPGASPPVRPPPSETAPGAARRPGLALVASVTPQACGPGSFDPSPPLCRLQLPSFPFRRSTSEF